MAQYVHSMKECVFLLQANMLLNINGLYLAKLEKMFLSVSKLEKSIDKFKGHEGFLSRQEAKIKWMTQKRPTIGSQLNP